MLTDQSDFILISLIRFSDFTSPLEESVVMMSRVQSYLRESDIEDQYLPWEPMQCTIHGSKERSAKVKAIEEHLGVFPDGTHVPLTLRQKLYFNSPLLKLKYKISKIRQESGKIVEIIDAFEKWEESVKNTRLIRYFILECLSPLKRYTLEVFSTNYDEYPNAKCSWRAYIIAWVFVTATLCFFMYWIFAWGVYQGDATLAAWGAVFGTSAANDILLVQMTKILILYYLPMKAMQSQLLRIRGVLADVAINYINRHDSEHEEVKAENESEISVVQHMSAACRAARSPQLRDLSSAWLLRQVSRRFDEIR